MDNPEFVAQIRHLHQDVRYMLIRALQVNDKSILDLEKSGDYLECCCQKLAEALLMVTQNAAQYARELENYIRGVGPEIEYRDTLKLLMLVTLNSEPVKPLENVVLVKSNTSSEELNSSQDLFDQTTVANTPPDPHELNLSGISDSTEQEEEQDKRGTDSDSELASWLVPNDSSNHTTTNEQENDELTNSTDLSTCSQETVICEMKNTDQECQGTFIADKIVNVPQNGDSDATDLHDTDGETPSEEEPCYSPVFSFNQSEEKLSYDEPEEEILTNQKRAFFYDLGLKPNPKPKLVEVNEDSEQHCTASSLVATSDNAKTPNTASSENMSQLSSSTEDSETMQLHKKLNKELRYSLFKVIKKYFQKHRRQTQIDSSSSDNEIEAREIRTPKRKSRYKRNCIGDPQSTISFLNGGVSKKRTNSEDNNIDVEANQASNLMLMKGSNENTLEDEEMECEVGGPLEATKVLPLPIDQNPVFSSLDLDRDMDSSHVINIELSSKSDNDDNENIKGGPKRLRSSSESSMDSPEIIPSAKKSRLPCESLLLDSEGRDGLVQLLDEHQHVVELGELRMMNDNNNDVQIVSVQPACVPIDEPKSTDDNESVGANYCGELSAELNQQSTTCNENFCDEGFTSPVKFGLKDGDRDELLELLTKHMEAHKSDKNSPDTPSTNSEGECPNPGKKILLGLIEEFKEAVNKETGSDTESCLMDVLREETVTEGSQHMNKRDYDKTFHIHDKEAWEAYQDLMGEDDDLLSSSSCSDLSEGRFWSSQSRGRHKTLAPELRKKFGIDRDLFVKLERLHNCGLDLSESSPRRESSVTERLCNLGNILHISKRHKFSKRHKTRKCTVSLTSSSCSELSSVIDDREGTPVLVSEEERDMPANLWDNIKNSSDEEYLSVESDSEDEKWKSERDEISDVTEESSENEYCNEKTVVLDSSDEEDFVGVRKSRPAWRQDPLLNVSINFSSDSEAEPPKKSKCKRKAVNLDENNMDRKIKKKKKRRPIKTFLIESDTTTDDSDFEIISVQRNLSMPQTVITLSDEDVPSKKSKGRRNIRALVEDEDLAEATQRANNEERERIRRLQERDKTKETFRQSFMTQENDDDTDPLILDAYQDTEIRVHPKITRKLKPHQREGVQFMWDSCYESVKQLKEGNYKGSGAILAHCMGLGKTLQALALIQALFNNPISRTNHVLVVCPLSTVANWKNEYKLAYKGIKDHRVKFHSIEVTSQAQLRFDTVNNWRDHGGMLVMGYECFGLLVNEQKLMKWEKNRNFRKEDILKALVDPGPDLVICDEGHLLRNQQSQRTLALSKIKTKRRIILTGTPLQNNLLEYYYMVNFVKPCLLGTEKEYKTNFVNPIHNGQFEDSTAEDIMFMKKRTHVLHKILISTVQRVEDTELKRYLPKLVDQAVFVKLSDLQVQLYNTYLDSTNPQLIVYTKKGQICRSSFLADVQMLQYICLHPNVLYTAEQKARAKATVKEQDVIEDNLVDELEESQFARYGRVKNLLSSNKTNELSTGTKLEVAVGIVREAEACGDKVLIFSQSHAEMDNLEYFLQKNLNYKNKWDYYRMDGTVSPTLRSHMCSKFNDPKNKTIKVFIMSKKVGGLGLNLTAANRVIIMNVSWNPSYDTQSVFRAFRFGQEKAVFVYRLIAIDTMEEKMYQRVVTKLAIAHRVVDKYQITRHYSSADIQEFYSVRPTVDKERPVPNVPEDRILAKIIQTHKHLFRWHEHQALLANRPEEDLDEQQKNAAWEEFNKMPIPESSPTVVLNQCSSTGLQSNASNHLSPILSGLSGRRRQNYHKLYPNVRKLYATSPVHDAQKESKTAEEAASDAHSIKNLIQKRALCERGPSLNAVFTVPEEDDELINIPYSGSYSSQEWAKDVYSFIYRFAVLPDHTYSRLNTESHPFTCYPSLDDFKPPPLNRPHCQSYRHIKLPTRRYAFPHQRMMSADEFKPASPLRSFAPRHLFKERANKTPVVATNTGYAPDQRLGAALTITRETPSALHSQKPSVTSKAQSVNLALKRGPDQSKNGVRTTNVKPRNKVLSSNVRKTLNNQIYKSISSIKKDERKEKGSTAFKIGDQAGVSRFERAPGPSNEQHKEHTSKSSPTADNFAVVSAIVNEQPRMDTSNALATAGLDKQVFPRGNVQRKVYRPKASSFGLASATNGRNKPGVSIISVTKNQQRQFDGDPSRPDTQSAMQRRVRSFMEHLHLLQNPEIVNKKGSRVSPVRNKADPPLNATRDLTEFESPRLQETTGDPTSKKFVRVKPFFKLAPPAHSLLVNQSMSFPPAVSVHEVAKTSSSNPQKSSVGMSRTSHVSPLEKRLTRNPNNFPLRRSTTKSPQKPTFRQFVPMPPSKSDKENKSLRSPINFTSEEALDGPSRGHRELLDALKMKGVSVNMASKPAPGTT